MKYTVRIAKPGVGLILLIGGLLGLTGGQTAASARAALPGEIHSTLERTATTGTPFLLDGNYYGWATQNWAGYAVSHGPYTAVTGSWVVPSVAPSGDPTYSSAWTGIDGFDNAVLIQSGTDQDSSHGQVDYFPWWTTNEEGFLPQTTWTNVTCVAPCSATPAVFTVNPGDTMAASISETGTNVWAITLTDTTTGVGGAETGISHTASGGTAGGDAAEWIMERPGFINHAKIHLATLANYGTINFDHGTTNGDGPGFVANSAASDAGVMTQGTSKVISIPSVPDSDADGFNLSFGNRAPTAP
jgi:hypothetical protein